jgi:transposase InsO family protein
MEVSCQFHALFTLPLTWGKSHPMDRRQGVPQSWPGHCEEKNLLLLLGLEPWTSSLQPITILTELHPIKIKLKLT